MVLKNFALRALGPATVLAAVVTIPAHAASVTFQYTESFGAVPPDGPTPYATATFDDGFTPGSVTLTMQVSPLVGLADVTQMYFNLNTALDPAALSFTHVGGDGPTAAQTAIQVGFDQFQADGDGIYDILFDFPPPLGSQDYRFNAGETVMWDISGIPGLTALDFNFLGAPGPGASNPGPFLSVAKFQSTGPDQGGSDWVGAGPVVPVPAAVWLFASGLLGLIGIARKKKVA
jgi:hypothetical protein